MKKVIIVTVISLMTAACGDPEPQLTEPEVNHKIVSGTVVFRERIGITQQSRLEVELNDVSLSRAPAATIAAATIENPGQSPIPFSLEYDAAAINDRHTYSISARVLDRGHLILVSDTVSPALTRNAPEEVTVFVVRVSQNKLEQPDASIAGTEWILNTVNGRQVARPDRGPDIQLTLDEEKGAVSGYGGCNRFKGSYEMEGTRPAFGNLASTAMACESGSGIETEFLTALGEIDEIRVVGRTLSGYNQGALIISFEADPVR